MSPTPSTTGPTTATGTSSTPPGADVTVHQHNAIGQGEVPWDEVFQTLRDVRFDGVLSVCIFGWHEKADEYNRAALARLTEELGA